MVARSVPWQPPPTPCLCATPVVAFEPHFLEAHRDGLFARRELDRARDALEAFDRQVRRASDPGARSFSVTGAVPTNSRSTNTDAPGTSDSTRGSRRRRGRLGRREPARRPAPSAAGRRAAVGAGSAVAAGSGAAFLAGAAARAGPAVVAAVAAGAGASSPRLSIQMAPPATSTARRDRRPRAGVRLRRGSRRGSRRRRSRGRW